MQRLCHPNVIPLLGVSIAPHGGQLSVITELMPRGSVFQLLHPMGGGRPGVSGVPLPRVLAMRMLGDCARGMGYLHSMSPPIIHRDLKSQNLLVASDYSVRVADFGLARPTEGWTARDAAKMLGDGGESMRALAIRSQDALASTGEVCGTPAYMAPEQFAGIDVGPASDQFGFCASL